MNELIKYTFLGLFFGTFGTTIGGIIGIIINNKSNKFLSFILSFAGGLMLAIVCFDLLPEAMNSANIFKIIVGTIIGVICMIICEEIVENKFEIKGNSLLKTGIIASIGLAIHNFPEGLAIGSGFSSSTYLGYSLAIAICIHDIPEGISMAVPMKSAGVKPLKVIFLVILSGITTGIGAFFGKIIGDISESVIAICLSFAAGAMLYIVSGELIPESNKLYAGKINYIGNIIGFIIGFIATQL